MIQRSIDVRPIEIVSDVITNDELRWKTVQDSGDVVRRVRRLVISKEGRFYDFF